MTSPEVNNMEEHKPTVRKEWLYFCAFIVALLCVMWYVLVLGTWP